MKTATKELTADQHLAYLKKRLFDGVRYIKNGYRDYDFNLYSPSGELIETQRYIDYSKKEAQSKFVELTEAKYLGLFDNSDEDID